MNKKGPLEGVTVVDLTRVLAGPYATMVMADLGARVIKVEVPGHGDDSRHFGPFVGGKSAYFSSLNRGKQSIAVDLRDAEGRALFEALLSRADVLVENYRGTTMEKLGFDWDVLHARHPRLIYAAVSGFGHTGPYRSRPAYDMVVQAMGGIMSVTGQPDSPPTRVGTSVGDITAGLFGLSGVLAALYDRERTGVGVKVDVGMLDCQVAILENAIARYFAGGEVPRPLGARHPSITPFDAFATASDPIIIAAGNNNLFARLCDVLGCPSLADDARFDTNDRRTANHEALKQALEIRLAARAAIDWLDALGTAGVPCGPINDVSQVVDDPHVRERNMIIECDDPVSGVVHMAGNPIKLSDYDDPARREPAPELDADRERILAWLAGEVA
jgi:CoA:oxalate CoA-transferase